MRKTFRERFDEKWIPEPNTGCWLWMGCTTSGGGYGRIANAVTALPTVIGAHVAAWLIYRGPVPDGLMVDHTCRVRSCVNPDHLRVVTQLVNNTENSSSFAAVNSAKSCCPTCGGAFTPCISHSRIGNRRPWRVCLPCWKAHELTRKPRTQLIHKHSSRPKTA